MSFKIFLNISQQPIEIRRITVSNPPPTWSNFQQLLEQLFPSHLINELLMQYEDDEKELICIHSQVEWVEALNVLQSLKIKKIFLSDSKEVKIKPPQDEEIFQFVQIDQIELPENAEQNPESQIPSSSDDVQNSENSTSSSSSSSSPTQEPLEENEKTSSLIATRESFQNFAQSLPQLLNNLFHGLGVPLELPQWFKDCVEKAKKEGQELNLEKHYHEFVDRGREFLNHDIYDNAKKAFENLLAMKEKHPEIMKNLATEAQVIKVDALNALNHIQASMQSGIVQVSNIFESDEDFQALKAKPELGSLVDFFRKKFGVPPPPAPLNNSSDSIVNEENVLPEFPPQIEPQVVPVVNPQNPEINQFLVQLETLKSMGFNNDDVNKVLLEEAKGDFDQVLSILLDGPQV